MLAPILLNYFGEKESNFVINNYFLVKCVYKKFNILSIFLFLYIIMCEQQRTFDPLYRFAPAPRTPNEECKQQLEECKQQGIENVKKYYDITY